MFEETSLISGYHAHIYYDPKDRNAADQVRNGIAERFDVYLGRWHDTPVGPHPRAMFQVAFSNKVFPLLIPWLMLNRQGLSILIHPETGDDLTDHTANCFWMGDQLPLDLSFLKKQAEPSEN